MRLKNTLPGILNKINSVGISSLSELDGQSFAEIRRRVNRTLTNKETLQLHEAVQQQVVENRHYEARLFTRSNPLLQNAVQLAMSPPGVAQHDYDSMFGGRSSYFVAPDSVASMFSPAAYLTELYREARALRISSSAYHLDQRRPDLQALTLDQQNLDQSLSVLELSNELLMAGAMADLTTDEEGVLTHLSTWRHSGMTPYHAAFERVRQAVLARGGVDWPVETAPDVMGLISDSSLLGMNSGYSPELYAILNEAVTADNAGALYTRNFGSVTAQSLMSMQALNDYYDVEYEPLQYFVNAFSRPLHYPAYQNEQYVYADVSAEGDITVRQVTRSYPANAAMFNYVALLPVAEERYDLQFSFSQTPATAALSIRLNGTEIFNDPSFNAQAGEDYRVRVNISDVQLVQPLLFEFMTDVPGSAQFVFADMAPEHFLLEMNKWVRLLQVTGLTAVELESAVRSVVYSPVGQVNIYITGDQNSPCVGQLPDGGWVVVWQCWDLQGYGVFLQRYTAYGEKVGGEIRIDTNTYAGGSPSGANISALIDGGWVVTWHSSGPDGSSYGIFQQRYDASGIPVGSIAQVNTQAANWQVYPGIRGLKDGGWVVSWRNDALGSNNNSISQQRFDRSGKAIGNETLVNTTTSYMKHKIQSAHTLVTLKDGGWVTVWNTNTQDGTKDNIYFRRFDATGNAIGGEVKANSTTAGGQINGSAIALEDGGWVVLWTSESDSSSLGTYMQRYNADGTMNGSEALVNTTTYDMQDQPTGYGLPDGGWIVAWVSYDQDGSKYGIYQQRFKADGSRNGGEVRVNVVTYDHQQFPCVAALTDGGWVVVFQSNLQDGSGYGIYQQRYNEAGVVASEAGWNIDSSVLRRIADMQLYMQRYTVGHEQALALCNAPISEQAYGDELSEFDRLFNSPPLNGFVFTADGTTIDLNPGSTTDDPRRAVLARAFRADEVSLYRLLQITGDSDGLFPNDIPHLSDLHLARQLADVHGLSIDDLAWLLQALGEGDIRLSELSDMALRRLVLRLHAAVQSLTALKWSAAQLLVMTTENYATTLTPEIQNLLDTLNIGLHGTTLTGDSLISAMAPHVATLLRLSSLPAAVSLLTWIDRLQPAGLDVDAFWLAIRNNATPSATAVQFCHALAQLTLVYQATGLDERSLDVLVSTPEKLVTLPAGVTVAPHDATTLIQLGTFMVWVQTLGGNAATTLSALNDGTLTPAMVAQATDKDPHLLAQAASQAHAHGQITSAGLLSSWPEIELTLQWAGLGEGLGVAPKALSDWLALDYLNRLAPVPAYDDWNRVASALTAGIAAAQVSEVEGYLSEALSTALVAYYLREIADPALALSSRDDLYGYLLIDNKVSSAVQTTRIAEAIASVQLCINRALDGAEPGADPAVVSRPFFANWSRYNKRYSTWSGVSQLVYYPENYIDPTVRIGQTVLMDSLLQSINQSQLTEDTVGEAFESYLAGFEQVADLQVLSGYHDHTDSVQGMTYFIGNRRGDAQNYYWRSLNHDLASNGTFPANAWSEWLRIDSGINPHQQMIRPVVRSGRLYMAWVERIEQAVELNGNVTRSEAHVLKLAQRRYDGSWSAPLSYPVDRYLPIGVLESETPGFYCAEDPDSQAIVVMFYRRQEDPASASVKGFRIAVDMQAVDLPAEQAELYRDGIFWQFDTPSLRRINNRYDLWISNEEYFYSASTRFEPSYSFDRGAQVIEGTSISKLHGGSLTDVRFSKVDAGASISVQSIFLQAQFECYQADPEHFVFQRKQYDTMVNLLPPGGKVVFPKVDSIDVIEEERPCDGFICLNPDSGTKKLAFFVNRKVLDRFDYDNIWVSYSYGISQGRSFIVSDFPQNSYASYDVDYTGNITYITVNLMKNGAVVHGVRYRFYGDEGVFNTDIDFGNVSWTFGIQSGNTAPGAYYGEQNYGSMIFDLPPFYQGNIENLPYDENGKYVLPATFSLYFNDVSRTFFGKEYFQLELSRCIPLALHLTDHSNHAQYLQWGPYRTRLNTTFAHQLGARAAAGLEAILSLPSQQLPEPVLGHGGYINVTLPAYDNTLHGAKRGVQLELFDSSALPEQQTYFSFADVTLGDEPQSLTLFVPISQKAKKDPVDFPLTVSRGLEVHLDCASGRFKSGSLYIDGNTLQPVSFVHEALWNGLRDPEVTVMPVYVEPMDFKGANALYFWELFYYTPMLVAQRLLLEQQFDEAQRWLEFVWKPSGYLVDGKLQDYYWNVRPLLEDISWNSVPLDSTDPDAVAQTDPMHYKLCTFMRTLDLLLARGDAAYRQLERDSLNEAKQWYTQALHLLGPEPYVPLGGGWAEPSLGEAADETVQQVMHQGLAALRQGPQPDAQTANSLTSLFLPQANEALLTYWHRAGQRMFNLRHNLSIDGQPLALPIYAAPADPTQLRNAAVASALGVSALPAAYLPQWRFPQMLENARAMVSQLSQFGATLLSVRERQDAEALGALLQGQAKELILLSLNMQNRTLAELDAEHESLTQARRGAKQRLDSFTHLYEENINSGETAAMNLYMASSVVTTASTGLHMAAAALEMVPNIYGLAVGGSRYGALLNAVAMGSQLASSAMQASAAKIGQSEIYRRRRQEWEIQRNNADAEVAQLDAQLQGNALRRESAVMQQHYLESQQQHTQAQLAFLQGKFSNQALYSWMNGRLSALYFQLYDLAVGRCLMAEQSYRHVTQNATASFIKPGAWQSSYAGLLSGETLQLGLAQMDDAYLRWDARALEVTRTLSLADIYAAMPSGAFDLDAKIDALL
uniref:Tc toxin subunit A-related protein n=1 Tax=Aeromonas aquatica TaxID=558964 RepID=UPI00286F8B85